MHACTILEKQTFKPLFYYSRSMNVGEIVRNQKRDLYRIGQRFFRFFFQTVEVVYGRCKIDPKHSSKLFAVPFLMSKPPSKADTMGTLLDYRGKRVQRQQGAPGRRTRRRRRRQHVQRAARAGGQDSSVFWQLSVVACACPFPNSSSSRI